MAAVSGTVGHSIAGTGRCAPAQQASESLEEWLQHAGRQAGNLDQWEAEHSRREAFDAASGALPEQRGEPGPGRQVLEDLDRLVARQDRALANDEVELASAQGASEASIESTWIRMLTAGWAETKRGRACGISSPAA